MVIPSGPCTAKQNVGMMRSLNFDEAYVDTSDDLNIVLTPRTEVSKLRIFGNQCGNLSEIDDL